MDLRRLTIWIFTLACAICTVFIAYFSGLQQPANAIIWPVSGIFIPLIGFVFGLILIVLTHSSRPPIIKTSLTRWKNVIYFGVITGLIVVMAMLYYFSR